MHYVIYLIRYYCNAEYLLSNQFWCNDIVIHKYFIVQSVLILTAMALLSQLFSV